MSDRLGSGRRLRRLTRIVSSERRSVYTLTLTLGDDVASDLILKGTIQVSRPS